MTHLAFSLFRDADLSSLGLWMFLSVGAVALFVVFIPLVSWIDNRRKEREAFYKAETMRRLVESSGEGTKAALELLREQSRQDQLRKCAGLKIGGVVNIAVGLSLVIFLRALIGWNLALCGLIPGFVGVALLLSSRFMATPAE
jgi:hypothetical protein